MAGRKSRHEEKRAEDQAAATAMMCDPHPMPLAASVPFHTSSASRPEDVLLPDDVVIAGFPPPRPSPFFPSFV